MSAYRRITAADVTDDMLRCERERAIQAGEMTLANICESALMDCALERRMVAKIQVAAAINRRAGFPEYASIPKIDIDQIEWVVNDLGELGVKIGQTFAFLYKGESYVGGQKWRSVGKREFGETCQPARWWNLCMKSNCGSLNSAANGGPDSDHKYRAGDGWLPIPGADAEDDE